jgi:transcriptional regulator with XRE-family HTH domain
LLKILQVMAYKQDSTQDFLRKLGDNIRHYRKKKGFTLEALGEDLGLDKGNMHHMEAGKNMTVVTLMKIALFLDVPMQKLIPSDVNITLEEAEAMITRKRAIRRKKAATKTASRKKKK